MDAPFFLPRMTTFSSVFRLIGRFDVIIRYFWFAVALNGCNIRFKNLSTRSNRRTKSAEIRKRREEFTPNCVLNGRP